MGFVIAVVCLLFADGLVCLCRRLVVGCFVD